MNVGRSGRWFVLILVVCMNTCNITRCMRDWLPLALYGHVYESFRNECAPTEYCARFGLGIRRIAYTDLQGTQFYLSCICAHSRNTRDASTEHVPSCQAIVAHAHVVEPHALTVDTAQNIVGKLP